MDIRNVAVITDGNKFQKSDVVRIIKEEGYKHNFVFITPNMQVDNFLKYMSMVDEVWCFGNCDGQLEYRVAKEIGADIWQMG